MTTSHSTQSVRPNERLSYWLEVATKAFVSHEFVPLDGADYRGKVHAGALDGLGVSSFECDPCRVRRSDADVARGDSEDILLCLQLGGRGLFAQDGRQAVNENGSFLLIDTQRPFSIEFPERVNSITFKMAREALKARLGDVDRLTARALSARGALAGLASNFLSMLPPRLDALGESARVKLAEQALDLVALVFSEAVGTDGLNLSSPRAAATLRLKAAIEAGLRRSALKPAAVAAQAGISVRYANELLAQEGASIERYILWRRLECCRRALEDPLQGARTVGEIAFAWGFSDPSHFGRRFRAEYGCAPGDYRRRALETGGP